MSAMHRFAVKGFYKEQFCRSLHEFHACLYLDKVKKVEFITEPFSMRSAINSKRKIPDIMYFDHSDKRAIIVEIKPNMADIIDVIISYSTNKYRCPNDFVKIVESAGYLIDFEFLVNTKKTYKKDIISKIGKAEYVRLLAEYRSQEPTYTGFPGKLNPMYDRKHSQYTKDLISKTASHPGAKNGMYGKTHTTEAKKRSAAKWKDPMKKAAMMKKGMLTHISKFTDAQYTEFMAYAENILSNIYSKRPDFINRAYTINETNIVGWFGSVDNFFKESKYVK